MLLFPRYYIISESGRAVELEAAEHKNSPVCLRSPPNRCPTVRLSFFRHVGEADILVVRLGKSGLKVSKIILGCMSCGLPGGPTPWSLGEEEGIAHIKAAYDAGINTFDTANVYSNGLSEVILGKAIKKHNLNRETMRALHDVVQAGHARYLGMSSCYAWQFHMMQNYAITNGLTPFISMQNHYCTLYREEESPLARGILTRPLAQASTSKRQDTDPILGMYLKNPKRQKDRRPAGGGGGAHRREHGTDRARVADGQGRGDGADCGDDVAGEPAEPAWCVL
ncbi:hypothetical protein HWV62_5447 [Athelia sp. TMB]|nr:hypothetical protein HWV62_5447 [Athelia sp. TMB]